jgi:hypothetical protein
VDVNPAKQNPNAPARKTEREQFFCGQNNFTPHAAYLIFKRRKRKTNPVSDPPLFDGNRMYVP